MQENHSKPTFQLHVVAPLDVANVVGAFSRRYPLVTVDVDANTQNTDTVVVYPTMDMVIAHALQHDTPVQAALEAWDVSLSHVLKGRTAQTILIEYPVLINVSDASYALATRLKTQLAQWAHSEEAPVSDLVETVYAKIAHLAVASLGQGSQILAEIRLRSFHMKTADITPSDVDTFGHDVSLLRAHYRAQRSELRLLVDTTQTNIEKQRVAFETKAKEFDQKANDILGLQKIKETEIARLAKEIKSLKRSTSWRITGPLRRVIRLLRRGKKR